MFPTTEQITALHRKYAPDETTFELIYTHCRIVADIALQLFDKKPQANIDKRFIEAACLLHDIGAYKLFQNGSHTDQDYILHGIKGQEILEAEGYDPKICRVASHHTGVGLKKADIIKNNLPLPHEDFLAETPEEELIMYADKFHSKKPRFNSYESYLVTTSKFGMDNVNAFKNLAEKFGMPDLAPLSRAYNHPVE